MQCKARRYKKKILKLKDLIKNLEDKRFITGDQAWTLENMNVTTQEILGRYKQKLKSGKNIRTKFSANLRSFAATLHFYSPKAYEFVRTKFDTCLPHVRTLKKWYQSINAEPGFTTESLNAIKAKVQASKHALLCNLVLDEMAIRKRIEWDGTRMHGYVDIGTGSSGSGDSSDVAKEALVFLITAINGAWKIPVAYFFTAGLSGEQKANLVTQCLELLHTTGIEVTSLTFDGCPAHISMAKKLGCSFDIDHMVTNFKHPITNKPVHVFLDACHMIKLVRNSFQTSGGFKDNEGKSVKWSHLVKLNELQEKEHLHLANKLRRKHILFRNNIMKVRLATQLMSNSVAEALRFCSQQNIPDFTDVDGTVTFLKNMNKLFDILNSRNMNQIYFKKPLYFRNKDKIFEFLNKVETYVKSLKLPNDQDVVKSTKKTGFIGLLTCIHSLKNMYISLIENEKKIHYLPAYKLSQDHIELTFGHIRAHGGCNNNPTARQFMSIYKKLIAHVELKEFNSGNCVALENISLLNCSSALEKINMTTVNPFHPGVDNEDDTDESILNDVLSNYDISSMSEFGSHVVVYIAGSVVHYLMKKIKCETCQSVLLASGEANYHLDLINLKDNGGLIVPSTDVIKICKITESLLRKTYNNSKFISAKTFKNHFVTKTMAHFLGLKLFETINFHQYDHSPLDNHVIQLTKCVLEKYMDIRLNHFAKNVLQNAQKRQLFNKFLHFTGQ